VVALVQEHCFYHLEVRSCASPLGHALSPCQEWDYFPTLRVGKALQDIMKG